MKKRLLSLVLCLVMVFSLLPSFAMAEVFPVTGETEAVEVRFYDSENKLINTQRVIKQNPNDTLKDGAIYDPGCPLPAGDTKYIFDKWSWGDGQTGTVDDILDYIRVNANWNALKVDGDNVKGLNVTATLSKVRYLVYRDENNRVLKTDYVVEATSTDDWNIDVNYDYVPVSTSDEFFGWTTQAMDVTGRDVQYENKGTAGDAHPEKIWLEGTYTNLYPVCKTGYWLMFDNYIEQDDDTTNATFASPVLYRTGDHTAAPDPAPTRAGYTLEGWYTDKNFSSSSKYTFGSEINADTTLYAHWTPNETTYTVVYWQQKASDAVDATDEQKTYDYYGSDVRNATTGVPVSITTADTTMGGTESSTMGYYFTYNAANSDKTATVNGDGSTVLNVYYDRRVITLNFYEEITACPRDSYYGYYDYPYDSEPYVRTYADHWGASGNRLVPLTMSYNSYYVDSEGDIHPYYVDWRYNGSSYSGTVYHRTVDDSSHVYKKLLYSISGLYDSKITGFRKASEFDDGCSWYMYSVDSTHQLFSVSEENVYRIFRGTTQTTQDYYLRDKYENNPKNLEFIGQDTSGNFSAELRTDILAQEGSIYFSDDTFKGFKPYGYNVRTDSAVDGSTGFTKLPSGATEANVDYDSITGDTLYIYFARNQHRLIFNSNGTQIRTEDVFYEKNLSSYAKDPDDATNDFVPTNGHPGYYFDGWYADPSFGTPFDFDSTMPDANVTVYAKWTKMRFRVEIDPVGTGADSSVENPVSVITFPQVSEGKPQATTFRVDYGEAVGSGSLNQAKWGDGNKYELVGWYYIDKQGKAQDFNFAYVNWDQIADMGYKDAPEADRQGTDLWTGTAYNDADGDHDDVVGKLTIHAKWRQIMNPKEYITVVYDANEAHDGIGAPDDDLHYADQAQVIAQPASKSGVSGETFAAWQVLGADGETVVDEIQPGEIFSVRLEDSVEGTGVDENGDSITTHTVKLLARYTSETKTHVTWVGNGGTAMVDGAAQSYVNSGDANLNAKIDIMPANTFNYENHVFLGWARLKEDGNKNVDGTWVQHPELTAADLWLRWDYAANDGAGAWYLQNGTEAIGIAANEEPDLHVLYAVWAACPPKTFLIDFNAPMTVATGASVLKDDTHKNGKFEKSAETTPFSVTYQIKPDELLTDGADLSFSGVDSAVVYGVPSNSAAGTTASWNKITTVPASSVYFDDDLRTHDAIAVGDGSGYNAQITSATSVTGESDKLDGTYTVQFHGSRIDVYCTTDATSLAVTARVKNNATQQYVKNLLVSNKFQDENINVLYNVPTISVDCGAVGDYTLELTVKGTANYRFDGIRIYDPVDNGNYTGEAASEANATFLKVRDQLLPSATITAINDYFKAKKAYDEAEDKTGMTEPVIPASAQNVQGVMFYMDKGASTVADDDPLKNMKVAAEYGNYGPKNEIYLKQGEGLSFSIQNGPTENMKAWIGLSAPQGLATGNNVIVTVNGTTITPAPALTAVDMYYLLDGAQNGQTITIQNDGPNLISVTNVKITGSTKGNPGLDASVLSVADAETAASVLSVDDGLPYLAVTAQEVKTLNAPAQAEDPQPTADPEPTPTADPEPTPTQPSIAEWISNLFSSFVNALFGSIARLFGN